MSTPDFHWQTICFFKYICWAFFPQQRLTENLGSGRTLIQIARFIVQHLNPLSHGNPIASRRCAIPLFVLLILKKCSTPTYSKNSSDMIVIDRVARLGMFKTTFSIALNFWTRLRYCVWILKCFCDGNFLEPVTCQCWVMINGSGHI